MNKAKKTTLGRLKEVLAKIFPPKEKTYTEKDLRPVYNAESDWQWHYTC
jgi:hypothetical protein